jgi:hypothetical protein
MQIVGTAPANTLPHSSEALASLERLAHFHCRMFGADRREVRAALKAWVASREWEVRAATIGELTDFVVAQYAGDA